MSASRLARMTLGLVLAVAGTYVFVYLWRWEWNRALMAGVLFLVAEMAMVALTVLERLRRIEHRLDQQVATASGGATGKHHREAAGDTSVTLTHLRETAPAARQAFAWLRSRQDQLGVFVPILMGLGVVASALAWLVERLARATARPALERGLAARLQVLAWPHDPLDEPHDSGGSSLLAGPLPPRR